MERVRRLLQIIVQHRRRVATLVMIVGMLLVGTRIFGAVPRDVTIEYSLPSQPSVTEVGIGYFLGEDELIGVRFDHPGTVISHQVSLSPGRYRIEAIVRSSGQERLVSRALRVPADGVVRMDLGDDRQAQ